MCKHATIANSIVVVARFDSAANRSSAADSWPVKNSHSARFTSSANASSCRRSHASSGNIAVPDQLGVAFGEFRLDLRHVAELRGADRREVLGMREQDRPTVAAPVM